MDSKVEIKLPETLIADMMRAEIVRTIPNKELFAEKVIEAMLQQKTNSYSRETLFQDAIRNMIIEEGKKIFAEWLEQNRKLIKSQLLKHLTKNKQHVLIQICESLANNMTRWSVTTNLKINGE